ECGLAEGVTRDSFGDDRKWMADYALAPLAPRKARPAIWAGQHLCTALWVLPHMYHTVPLIELHQLHLLELQVS
ncbi:MAG TPA: hypothetical protein VIY07_09430, partial [Pseudolabrys sp.]